MNWIRNHPIFDAFIATGLLLSAGFIVVRARSGVAPVDVGLGTWQGSGGVTVAPVSDSRRLPGQSGYTPPSSGSGTRAETHGTIPLNTGGAPIGSTAGGDDNFDFDAFVALLSKPGSSKKGASGGADMSVSSSYSFIPRGLIASSTPDQSRSETQDMLFGYGNEAGDAIQSFERNNPDQPVVLKNFIERRGDAETIEAMKKLGDELSRTGDSLEAIDPVPPAVQTAHTALAKSYKDIGAKLAALPDAKGDDALFDAIQTYDRAAEAFAKKYVALALIFQSYGVVFSPGDGGSVFVMPNGSF